MLPSNNLHTIFFPYFDICVTLISVLEGTETLPPFSIMMLIYQLWDIFEVSENLGMNFQLPSFKVSFASSAHLKCETITNFGLKNHVIKRGLVNKTILYYKCAHH